MRKIIVKKEIVSKLKTISQSPNSYMKNSSKLSDLN